MAQGTIAKVLPIPKQFDPNKRSTANSLLQKGYNRQPGAKNTIYPVRLSDGRYLTGLDEDAPHVLSIKDDAARKAEIASIKERRARLERQTGLKLGPRSLFYSKISQADPQSGIYNDPRTGDSTKVASAVRLTDGENVFNFADPFQEIAFLWVSLHPNVAPSLEAWKKGADDEGNRVSPSVQFYVQNPEKEANVLYKEKMEILSASNTLKNGSVEQRKKWAKLLGLLVSDSDREQEVLIALDDFIKSGEVKSGEYKGYRAVPLFNTISTLKDNLLNTKALIKDAITLGVYKLKNKVVFEGDYQVAEDTDMLLKHLVSSAGQEDYIALEEKVNNKKGIVPTK